MLQQRIHPPGQEVTTLNFKRRLCFKSHWTPGRLYSALNGCQEWYYKRQVPGLCFSPFIIVYCKVGDYKSLKATDLWLMNILCQHSGLHSYISSADLAVNLSRKKPSLLFFDIYHLPTALRTQVRHSESSEKPFISNQISLNLHTCLFLVLYLFPLLMVLAQKEIFISISFPPRSSSSAFDGSGVPGLTLGASQTCWCEEQVPSTIFSKESADVVGKCKYIRVRGRTTVRY